MHLKSRVGWYQFSNYRAPDLLNSCNSTLGKKGHIRRVNSMCCCTRHDTTRHDATWQDTTRHDATQHIIFPERRVFRLRVWNVGMWASLVPEKGRQIVICGFGVGQKAKTERALTKSEDIEWRNLINLDLGQVSWLSTSWWDGTDYVARVRKWDFHTEINLKNCREKIISENSAQMAEKVFSAYRRNSVSVWTKFSWLG